MIYHVLPGDAQVNEFKQTGLDGEVLVCREALIDGDLSGATLDEFFNNRAAFINETSDDPPFLYSANVASQFRQLQKVDRRDEVNLWFEYELFCSVNMWFCIDLVKRSGADVYRVAPIYRSDEDRWDGFGGATADDLIRCFEKRVRLSDRDIKLGSELWKAFKTRDWDSIRRLTAAPSPAFPYLEEVGEAAVKLDSLPANIIAEIKSEGINNFSEIFAEFRRRAGVFGFGDSQVKNVMAASA